MLEIVVSIDSAKEYSVISNSRHSAGNFVSFMISVILLIKSLLPMVFAEIFIEIN